jgi:hypothetical protein
MERAAALWAAEDHVELPRRWGRARPGDRLILDPAELWWRPVEEIELKLAAERIEQVFPPPGA